MKDATKLNTKHGIRSDTVLYFWILLCYRIYGNFSITILQLTFQNTQKLILQYWINIYYSVLHTQLCIIWKYLIRNTSKIQTFSSQFAITKMQWLTKFQIMEIYIMELMQWLTKFQIMEIYIMEFYSIVSMKTLLMISLWVLKVSTHV